MVVGFPATQQKGVRGGGCEGEAAVALLAREADCLALVVEMPWEGY